MDKPEAETSADLPTIERGCKWPDGPSGWQVTIVRQRNGRLYEKFFLDYMHGGRDAALAAARAWCDQKILAAHSPVRGRNARRAAPSCQSGAVDTPAKIGPLPLGSLRRNVRAFLCEAAGEFPAGTELTVVRIWQSPSGASWVTCELGTTHRGRPLLGWVAANTRVSLEPIDGLQPAQVGRIG